MSPSCVTAATGKATLAPGLSPHAAHHSGLHACRRRWHPLLRLGRGPSLPHPLPAAPPAAGLCPNCSFCLELTPQVVPKFLPSLVSASTDAVSSEITLHALHGNWHIYCLSFSLECTLQRREILFIVFTFCVPAGITTQTFTRYSMNVHSVKKWKYRWNSNGNIFNYN